SPLFLPPHSPSKTGVNALKRGRVGRGLRERTRVTIMAATKTIKVQQTGSPQRRHHTQRETLIGLGLNKIGRVKELPDTPATRGMILKVHHLVRVVDEK